MKKEQKNKPGRDKQDVDKAPGEDRGKSERLTPADLKGKKVDADPSIPADKPVPQQRKTT